MRTAAAPDRPHLLPGWQDPVDPAALMALRREIHRTAEIGWAEFISTARLAQAFETEGFKITFCLLRPSAKISTSFSTVSNPMAETVSIYFPAGAFR